VKVSCILPTANRRKLLLAAIKIFAEQTYKDCELVILDDGDDPLSTWEYYNYGNRRVVYRHEKAGLSLGEKHNRLVKLSAGEVIIQWADDDWYAMWRVAYQVKRLTDHNVDMCAIINFLAIDAERELAWHIKPPGGFINSSSLCYRKDIWKRCPYRDVATGEDHGFMQGQLASGSTLTPAHNYFCTVQRIHRGCTSSRDQMSKEWSTDYNSVKAVIGKDWEPYFSGPGGMPL
jgi:glycosyltransferase involved in cell wall biosynthesis